MSLFFKLLYIKRFYFFPAFLFAALLLSLLFLYPNGRSFFIINGIHSALTDGFFMYATHLGDGIFALIMGILLLLFYRYSAGIAAIAGFACTGGLNSLLKTYVFVESQRPKLFFWNNPMVHYVGDTYVNIEHSFPSGHSTTAFFIFTYMTLLRWKNDVQMQMMFILLACIAAYSRVYLAQHFIGDIMGGMCLGMSGAFGFYALYRKLRTVKALDKNILTHRKK